MGKVSGGDMVLFASHEWPLPRIRRPTSFELEGTQVEQVEDQLKAKKGVAKQPGSGGTGGMMGGLAGAVGGMMMGSKGAKHSGDGRVGAGQRKKKGMLNDALGGMGAASGLATMGASMAGDLLGSKKIKLKHVDKRNEEAVERSQEEAQLTGEGEDVATVADVSQQAEVDEAEEEEGEGPPAGDVEEAMGKAPDVSVADLYKYYTNKLARRARQAAILADNAVQEAWKQQQLARYWSRQALEDEVATMRALPAPKTNPEQETWQLHVPPGWELPSTPLISTRDPRTVTLYSGATETLCGGALAAPCFSVRERAPRREAATRFLCAL
ncbi:unnamed protein product [Effrenium voratum]|uniref:Uncharacterized protein n=1 Tax=Effrenium voratum TaxID=2562239 RepID=A0AA36IIP3_9DINO|nr:unnamed protein product [Effrenium voratum]CAJ1430041.1 unnamed protein product [Effrenium voratum]